MSLKETYCRDTLISLCEDSHECVNKNMDLGFTGELALSTVQSHTSRVMCVFEGWAIHREEHGKFVMEDVDATLCTHLILRYMQVSYDSGTGEFVLQDVYPYLSEEQLKDAVGLKGQNPKLKVILSVRGSKGDFQSNPSSNNSTVQWNLVNNIVQFLKSKKLDGLNVEWKWTTVNKEVGQTVDWFRVTDLIKSLFKAIKDQNFELGFTLPSDTRTIERSNDIAQLERNVDYFLIIGQSFAGHWDQVTGHHSPLFPLTERTVGNAVEFVLDKQISPHKLILGIPFVGRTFELVQSNIDIVVAVLLGKVLCPQSNNRLGALTVEGKGLQGAFNKDGKVLNYNEICYKLRKRGNGGGWAVYEDTVAKVPFMKHGRKWVSFDNAKSVQAKVAFGEKHRLGGYAAWSITNDDFKGEFCGGNITYPLLRTINYILSKNRNSAKEVHQIATKRSDTTTNRYTYFPNSTSAVTSEKGTSRNDSFGFTTTKSTSPESRNEDEGRTEMSGTGGDSSVLIFVIVTLMGIILLLVVVFMVHKKRSGNKKGLSSSEIRRFKQGCFFEGVKDRRSSEGIMLAQVGENDFNSDPYDKCLEIPHTEYEISASEILGSGAYGIVVKGKVRNEVVAVKTLKPFASKEYVLSLLEEIKVMTYLGQHENIVGLIGANTVLLHRGIVYVFVEWCPLGSMENYLKGNRSSFVDLMESDEFTCKKSELEEDSERISSATLLIWAHQISNAMQYLASKNVIHGDLATRNVLLHRKHLVKVSDFGLSRKMYEYNNYIKRKQEPLPWRHMSLEALRDMEFSTKSDVWAFGVTLWEIFMLGALPYPGMSYTLGFLDDLSEGLRMPKPRHATTELYEKTMLHTWNENPQDRPSFEELRTFLRDFVERVSFQHEYFAVNDFTI